MCLVLRVSLVRWPAPASHSTLPQEAHLPLGRHTLEEQKTSSVFELSRENTFILANRNKGVCTSLQFAEQS